MCNFEVQLMVAPNNLFRSILEYWDAIELFSL